MILDSSAVLAVVLGEQDAESLLAEMMSADELSMSAANLVEAVIVARARQGDVAASDVHALLADLEADIVPLDEEMAVAAERAWRRFGKGRHPAGLNYGDCLAYATARILGRPLLCAGDAFPQTDVALVH